jgi:hypothetical protein
MTILHPELPFAPWTEPAGQRLPGIMPLARDAWLVCDKMYGPQMAERAALLATRPHDVLATLPGAAAAAEELLDEVLCDLPALGFRLNATHIQRPDGHMIALDRTRPLWTLGHLLQADFCLLQKPDGAPEHVLTGAVLCFPASWTLAEKLGKPLMRIHRPVDSYDSFMGARVQRLFDAIRPEQPLWRANVLRYSSPTLYQPKPEFSPHEKRGDGAYVRSERQCLLKLPKTGAVVFSIHTFVVLRDALTDQQRTALDKIEGLA